MAVWVPVLVSWKEEFLLVHGLGKVKSIMLGKKDTIELMEAESYGWEFSDLSRPGSKRKGNV